MLPELPPLETTTVALGDGVKVEVRKLSRVEALRISKLSGDVEAADNFILACGAGVTEEEALAWRSKVSPEDAGAVVDAICELSGLVEGAQKSG
jgi:hypothetical protein